MMDEPEKTVESWREFISPLKLIKLAGSWIGFCTCIVLLADGRRGALLVLLLIGTGVYSIAGLVGIIVAVRRRSSNKSGITKT